MEENKKNQSAENCCNGSCCGGICRPYGKYMLLRWLLGILILAIVFAVGVKVGEFKVLLQSDFAWQGRHVLMRGNSFFGQQDFYPYPMMGGYGNVRYETVPSSQWGFGVNQAQPATTTPSKTK